MALSEVYSKLRGWHFLLGYMAREKNFFHFKSFIVRMAQI
jgi:hypothetical protein